jgi:PhzF family phenazine biosynthesis protein
MLDYLHVDVFTKQIMSGNGLTVVFDNKQMLSSMQMQLITQEFKQFETIFIRKKAPNKFIGRVFTVEEELDFAGHPILGATACIHDLYFKSINKIRIELILNEKIVVTSSERKSTSYYVEMNQGSPEYLVIVPEVEYEQILRHLNLQTSNIHEELSIEVISTGLPYLLIPLQSGLEDARITKQNFEALLNSYGAKFVYLFDVNSLECRTWDNRGKVEDVATGSAAGPLCAFLVKNGLRSPNTFIDIHQGKFVNRASVIKTIYSKSPETEPSIIIGGNVSLFASGSINL